MNWQDVVDRFEFEEDSLLDDNVGLIRPLQTEVFVDDRKRDFAFERQTIVVEFPAEAPVVNSFQQAGAEFSVHLDAEVDNLVGQCSAGFWRHGSIKV